jgi:hypothetical protein
VIADRCYDHDKYRRELRRRGIAAIGRCLVCFRRLQNSLRVSAMLRAPGR